MTTFQTLTLIISGVTLLTAIFGVYVKLKVDITKVDIEIKNLQREFQQREIAILNTEKVNREDHKDIIKKLDDLIQKKC